MPHAYKRPSSLSGTILRHYWSEHCHERTTLLSELVTSLEAEGVPQVVHAGWASNDLDVYPHGWTRLEVCTVQEDHAGGKRLVRMRLRLRPNAQMSWALGGVVAFSLAAAAVPAVAVCAAALSAVMVVAWREGLMRRSRVAALADEAANRVGLMALETRALPSAAEAPTAEAPVAETERATAEPRRGRLEGALQGAFFKPVPLES